MGGGPDKGAAASLYQLCVNFALKSTDLPEDFLGLAERKRRQFQLPFCHLFPFRHAPRGRGFTRWSALSFFYAGN
jgi:hypothetical protein